MIKKILSRPNKTKIRHAPLKSSLKWLIVTINKVDDFFFRKELIVKFVEIVPILFVKAIKIVLNVRLHHLPLYQKHFSFKPFKFIK